jgi:hypothetical protein
MVVLVAPLLLTSCATLETEGWGYPGKFFPAGVALMPRKLAIGCRRYSAAWWCNDGSAVATAASVQQGQPRRFPFPAARALSHQRLRRTADSPARAWPAAPRLAELVVPAMERFPGWSERVPCLTLERRRTKPFLTFYFDERTTGQNGC